MLKIVDSKGKTKYTLSDEDTEPIEEETTTLKVNDKTKENKECNTSQTKAQLHTKE